MKLIFVLLACCLVVDSTECDKDKAQDRLREKAMEECQKEKKLTEEEAKTPSNLGCMYACMHKKIGYLNSDGTLNIERLGQGDVYLGLAELARKVFEDCLKSAKGDVCQTALCLETTKVS